MKLLYSMMGMNRDLQASHQILASLEESKAQSERIIDALEGVFAIVDRQLRVWRGNQNLARLLDTSDEELTGKNLAPIFSDSGIQTLELHVAQVFADVSPRPVEFEAALKTRQLASGTPRVYLWNLAPFSLPDGMTTQLAILTGRDVTEIKRATEDREVSASVQQLLIPSQDHLRTESYSLAAFYRAAARTGGDWWWYDQSEPNLLRVILGDVSGHGPGPAMVTAAIAGSVLTQANQLRTQGPTNRSSEPYPVQMLTRLDLSVRELCRGEFFVSLLMVELNFKNNRLAIATAGANRPSVFRARHQFEPLLIPAGDPLGYGSGKIGFQEIPFNAGDRLMLETDGLGEVVAETAPGRSRRLQHVHFLAERGSESPETLRNSLISRYLTPRGNTPLLDDVTFIIIDRH